MKAAEAKRIEKERTEKYQKLKGDAKDARSKYREKVIHGIESFWYICGWCVKYKLDATPEPSDEEEESSDEEDDGFGAKKKEVDEDPVARRTLSVFIFCLNKYKLWGQSYGWKGNEWPDGSGWKIKVLVNNTRLCFI